MVMMVYMFSMFKMVNKVDCCVWYIVENNMVYCKGVDVLGGKVCYYEYFDIG